MVLGFRARLLPGQRGAVGLDHRVGLQLQLHLQPNIYNYTYKYGSLAIIIVIYEIIAVVIVVITALKRTTDYNSTLWAWFKRTQLTDRLSLAGKNVLVGIRSTWGVNPPSTGTLIVDYLDSE